MDGLPVTASTARMDGYPADGQVSLFNAQLREESKTPHWEPVNGRIPAATSRGGQAEPRYLFLSSRRIINPGHLFVNCTTLHAAGIGTRLHFRTFLQNR